MKLTRKAIIDIVREHGFEGEAKSDAILAYIEENEIKFKRGGKDIDVKSVVKGSFVAELDEDEEGEKSADDDEGDDDEGMKHLKSLEDRVAELSAKNAKLEQERARENGHTKWTKAQGGSERTGSLTLSAADRLAVKTYDRLAARRKENPSQKTGIYGDGELALAAGAYMRKAIHGARDYGQKARDSEILLGHKVQVTYNDELGGYSVPPEFLPTWIDLRESYGGVAQIMNQIDMANHTIQIPRRKRGLTVYSPGEAGATTKSTIGIDRVTLTAQKRGAAAEISSELLNDSAANFADKLTEEGVYALEKDLEFAIIKGDGTSTYWNQLGLEHAFRKTITDAAGTFPTNAGNQAGIVIGSGATWTALDDVDFGKASGRLPEYAARDAVWLCSRAFHEEVITREQRLTGGASWESTGQGAQRTYKGYPVVTSDAMPKVTDGDQFSAYLGDFRKGAAIGRVRGSMTIATSTDAEFLNDTTVFRFLHRAGVCVHDVGNYSATAADREAGPIIAVITD